MATRIDDSQLNSNKLNNLEINVSHIKPPVNTQADLPTNATEGEQRLVKDLNKVFRYDTSLATPAWVELDGGSVVKDPVATQADLPVSGNDEGDIRLVKDTNMIYRWNGGTGSWEQVGSKGLTDEQKSAIGDAIFDGTKTSAARSLDGRLSSLSNEVANARGSNSTLSERLDNMSGKVAQTAVMVDSYSAYIKDYLGTDHAVDLTKSKNMIVEGGLARATKGGKIIDSFDNLNYVDTANSLNIDTSIVGELRLDSTQTSGQALTTSFTTGGTDKALLDVTQTLPEAYDWDVKGLTKGSTHGVHMQHPASILDNAGKKWVFYRDATNNYMNRLIINPDGSVHSHINIYTTYASDRPSTAIDHDGNIWVTFNNSGYGYLFMKFRSDGATLISATEAWRATSYWNQRISQTLVDNNGRIWVIMGHYPVWTSYTWNMLVKVYNPNGTLYGETWIDAPVDYGSRTLPGATLDKNGRVWITYFNVRDYTHGNQTARTTLWVTVLNSDLTQYLAPTKINYYDEWVHPHDISLQIVDTGNDMRIYYGANGGIFQYKYSYTGSRLTDSYGAQKSMHSNFGSSKYSWWSGTQSYARGYSFEPQEDCVFNGFNAYIGSSTTSSSYYNYWTYVLMEQTPNGWNELYRTTSGHRTDTIYNGVWNYVHARSNIPLRKGKTYSVMYWTHSGSYQQTWYDSTPPGYHNNIYGPVKFLNNVYASTSNLPAVYNWGYSVTGVGAVITRLGNSIVKTSSNSDGDLTHGVMYDKAKNKLYIAHRSKWDGQKEDDIYMNEVNLSSTSSSGDLISSTRLTTTTGDDHSPSVIKDDANNLIDVTFGGVDSNISSLWQLYTRKLKATKSKIDYYLSNDGGTSWVKADPGSAVTFAALGKSLKMRADVWTPRAGVVPILQGYSISEWNSTAGSVTGELITQQLGSTAPITRATLNVNEELRGTSNIEYYLSNDGGISWFSALPGVSVQFQNSGSSDLRMKAIFNVPSSELHSSILLDYAVTSTSLPSQDFVRHLQINMAKTNFKVAALSNASRYSLKNMIVDDFNDESGIDITKSDYVYKTIGSVSGGHKDRIPLMTSNTAPSGVASASSEHINGHPAYHAMNNDESSQWVSADGTYPHWLAYEFPTAKTVVQYTIKAYKDSYGPARAPKDWKLQAYDETLATPAWVDIHSVTGQINWSANEKRTFSITNSTAYKKYRILISANNGDTLTAISEFELQELISTANINTITDTTSVAPVNVLLTVDETLNTGSINYSVSRDGGTTWTSVTPEHLTDISSQPSGTSLIFKIVINGNAQLNALSYSWS